MNNKKLILIGLLFAVILAVFLSPFASSFPDGLEKVAENKDFLHFSEGKEILKGLMPDYAVSIIKNEKISTALAGFIGVIFTFLATYGLIKLLKKN
ncbi:MAG: hypothetical protein A2474_01575 [Elusimicrobia bacterium RIFOXYC2_FULL_34_12]|nr:MAG: hypothetical protein A2474_01575 [Elusimicrobia bacterium RIFOXYC2_FULL_34_12]OGS46802.1 MAG: hypothetical protein A2539_09675 [Elusimicrobia bacterium RIFOXYD2_FULL_34_15]HAM39734.1 hypothetical protein [Elusimicrobiota bacterium]